MLIFKNKPDTSTPINATNLNANFEELNTNIDNTGDKIGDLNDLETTDKTSVVDAINEVKDDIIYVEYSTTYGPASQANYSNRFTINTSVPIGYEWVGYEIVDNGYANAVITWILYSSSTACIIGFYTLAALTTQLTFKLRGIYKKV